MAGPTRSMLDRSTGRLLTVVQVLSLAVGLVAAWAVLGADALYSMASISIGGLLVVHVLRSSASAQVGYETGLLSGVQAMSWLGLCLAFDLLGVLWACALIATTRPVRTMWGRARHDLTGSSRDGASRGPRPGARETGPGSTGLRRAVLALPDLDVDALCAAWRRSYFQLLDARPSPVAAEVAHYRQCILDEIDHRDPYGLSRWLASGPRAAGNPLPFLQGLTAPDDAPNGPDGAWPDPWGRQENDGTS